MIPGGRVVVVVVVRVVRRGVSRVVDRVGRCVVRIVTVDVSLLPDVPCCMLSKGAIDVSVELLVVAEWPITGITQVELIVVGIIVVVVLSGSSNTTLPLTTLKTVTLPLTVVILWVLFWKLILLWLLFSITLLESELLESVLVTLCELLLVLVFILLLLTLLSDKSEEKMNKLSTRKTSNSRACKTWVTELFHSIDWVLATGNKDKGQYFNDDNEDDGDEDIKSRSNFVAIFISIRCVMNDNNASLNNFVRIARIVKDINLA